MKILVINGPNLNMLGLREPELYGDKTYADLLNIIRGAANVFDVEVQFFQSNHEGAIVDAIQAAYGNVDAIIINPAAYTHTSIAILDALKAVALPAVEVHLTDINSREPFRRVSYISAACIATIAGEGIEGYYTAMRMLVDQHSQKI